MQIMLLVAFLKQQMIHLLVYLTADFYHFAFADGCEAALKPGRGNRVG